MAKSMQEINYNVKMSIFKIYILDYLEINKFKCRYKGQNETRFSARIRAGASALRDNNLFGNYEISDFNKKLNIKKSD